MEKRISQPIKQWTVTYSYDILEVECPNFTTYAHGMTEDDVRHDFKRRFETAYIISIDELKIKNYILPY